MATTNLPTILMVGTGEYTTGFVGTGQSTSDKKIGVVALTMFDLRRRSKIASQLHMCGVSGQKFPSIRDHLTHNISDVYSNMDVTFTSYPSDNITDPEAYKTAIDALPDRSGVVIFTPDSTHHPIAHYALTHGHHVLLTKPATKLLSEHLDLLTLSRKHNALVYVEHHKRFDPAYADARHRALGLGDFNYFYAYMSQPKSQLATFKAWAGKDSDISYYLNSHHVDVCASMVCPLGWRPTRVQASCSRGIAEGLGCVEGTEDTISLMVDWEQQQQPQHPTTTTTQPHPTHEPTPHHHHAEQASPRAPKRATAIYTASWTAPQHAGVHSQQRFHYVASHGEISVDQARRGYEYTPDTGSSTDQVTWPNPFYMRYAPDEMGQFAGQHGYGYVSLEKFVDGVAALNAGGDSPAQQGGVAERRTTGTAAVERVETFDARGLPTLANTVVTSAILEAGRRCLDRAREREREREGGDPTAAAAAAARGGGGGGGGGGSVRIEFGSSGRAEDVRLVDE